MTQANRPPFYDGPFLICAVLCERVLEERDSVKTAVRMVDRIMRNVIDPNAPTEMQPFAYELSLLIRFKAGAARGGMPFQVRVEKPNGASSPSPQVNIFFEGEERGVDIVVPVKMSISMQGLYWIDVLLDNIRVTRVPFRVIYNPVRPLLAPGGANPELPPNQ